MERDRIIFINWWNPLLFSGMVLREIEGNCLEWERRYIIEILIRKLIINEKSLCAAFAVIFANIIDCNM